MIEFNNDTIKIKGNLDVESEKDLNQAVTTIAKEQGSIVFDLQEAGIVNNKGLKAFAKAAKLCPGKTVLKNVPESIQRIVRFTGLNRLLQMI